MRKLAAMLLGLGFSSVVLGEDLLQCLDPHLVNSLVAPSATNNPVAVTSDVPAELADYVLPAGFEWIGVVAGETRKTVALKASLPTGEALAAAGESLEVAGWTRANRPIPPASVFTFPNQPTLGPELCRGDLSGSLAVRDVDGARYLNFVYSANAGASRCGSSLSSRPAFLDTMRSEGPTLRFPAGTVNAGGGVSGGGSNRDYRTTVRVTSESTPAALLDVMGRQMAEQGWSIDSRWSGRHGAGATWSRQRSAGPVLGTLEIVTLNDATMEAQFRLRTL